MKLLTVEPVSEALKKLAEYAAPLTPETRLAPLQEAAGGILAQEIRASAAIPGFRRSTVDGWAVQARDTAGCSESVPVFLACKAPVEMGKPAPDVIGSGECAYVPTGGMLPEGADAVVMREYCEAPDERTMAVMSPIAPGGNAVAADEEAAAGELLLPRGTVLRAQQLGVLAAAGIAQAPVFAPWRITVISIGDELVEPQRQPLCGQVRDVNTDTLATAAAEAGLFVVRRVILPDEREAFTGAVRQGMRESDLVVVSGGSSQGDKDMTASVFAELGSPGVFIHGLAIKPGKPAIFGWDAASRTLLCGMPGHPVSALTVFRATVLRLWQQMTAQPEPLAVPVVLQSNVPGAPGRETYQLLHLRQVGMCLLAEPIFGKSGLITTMAAANAYLVIDRNAEGLRCGETAMAYLL